MWTGIVRDLDPIQISLPAVQILARSISSVHVGNIITLVLEEALLGNNDDDSTVKPIQQDISNCKCLCVEREKRERRYAKAFSMWESEREREISNSILWGLQRENTLSKSFSNMVCKREIFFVLLIVVY